MLHATHTLALLPSIGGAEYIIIAIVGLLIFGRRLPEVGRSLGKGIVEFKRGVQGLTDEVDEASSRPGSTPPPADTAPRQISADAPATSTTQTVVEEPAPAEHKPA